jgi:hypothetical protein
MKTMEKLVDRHIRDEMLGLRPLHQYQFAYQPGKSTETALHHVITHIEQGVENREVTLGAFLDIEGAFDSTSFDIITKAAKWMALETQAVLGSALCWVAGKSQPRLQEKLWRGLWPGSVHRGEFYRLCCGPGCG